MPARQAALLAEALAQCSGSGTRSWSGHSWAGSHPAEFRPGSPRRRRRDPLPGAGLSPVARRGRISWYYGPAAAAWLGADLQPHHSRYRRRARLMTIRHGGRLRSRSPRSARLSRTGAHSAGAAAAHVSGECRGCGGSVRCAVTAQHTALRRHSRADNDHRRAMPTGSCGPMFTLTGSRATSRSARLVILPGVGHAPHHAAPDLVAKEIRTLSRGASATEPATIRTPSGR